MRVQREPLCGGEEPGLVLRSGPPEDLLEVDLADTLIAQPNREPVGVALEGAPALEPPYVYGFFLRVDDPVLGHPLSLVQVELEAAVPLGRGG